MSPLPAATRTLFDLERIGTVGIALLFLYLAAGLAFFFLSFTSRHGRSRWPLHALMSLGIIAVGTGLVWAGFGAMRVLSMTATRVNVSDQVTGLALSLIGPFWFGLTGTLLGLLAAIRAIIGLIREPGPRF